MACSVGLLALCSFDDAEALANGRQPVTTLRFQTTTESSMASYSAIEH